MQQLNNPIHLNLVFLEPKRRRKRLNWVVNILITTVPFSFVQGDLVVETAETTEAEATVVRISFKGELLHECLVHPRQTSTT